MSHGPAGERARRPWGRYNYAFIAEISFCFSDAIPVPLSFSDRPAMRERGGEGGREESRACLSARLGEEKGEWHAVLPG